MLRHIYTTAATQTIISDSHPEGIQSVVTGYPAYRDSRSYNATETNPNGDSDTALIVAQADFADAVRTLATANNPSRVMWTVTITREDGQQIARKSWGALPDMTPEPQPEPEPEPEEPEEPEESEAE